MLADLESELLAKLFPPEPAVAAATATPAPAPAAESGTAKTTVYRWWPNKAALCMDLYLDVSERELRPPNTGDIAGDLKEIAKTVVRLQTKSVAGPAFIGLLTEAQLSPDSRPAFLAEFAERRRAATRSVLRRAIERGELSVHTDIDVVIDALGGAITFRLLQGHAILNSRFTDAVVDLVLYGCKIRDSTSLEGLRE